MRSPGICFSVLLVFVALYESIQAQETLSSDSDAKNYVARFLTSSVNKLNGLGNNIPILQNNANNVKLSITNTNANLNNLVTAAKSSVESSLNIISSAASISQTVSKPCADSAVSRKTKLTNQANEQITAALQSGNTFLAIESQIDAIIARLRVNTASVKVEVLQTCVKDVVVTLNNVGQVVNCLNGVFNAYVSYINSEAGLITTQFNLVSSQGSSILSTLSSSFNKIISNAGEAAWVEAEAILDCAGLSANARVKSASQRITSIDNQVSNDLRNSSAGLINSIANSKTILNNNINNATQSIESLLAKVESYATYFSYIAPDKIAAIKKELEQVRKNSTAQLDRIKLVYSEAVAAFDALNASLPLIYSEYKDKFNAISSVNFTALISEDITQRLNTADLQRTLNGYIVQLVTAANKANGAISTKIDEYNLLINKVNNVSKIRLNAEFVFAINATKTIETIYLLGGVEFRYSPSTVVVQLNNSLPVLSVVNTQTQLTNLYNQVKPQLNSFTISYNNTLQQLLNPTKVLIDNVLNNNPYINNVEVNVAFEKIYNDARAKIIAAINLALQNASNINNINSKINITAQLKAVEDAIKVCFNNAEQSAAIECANKVIADFNANIAQLQLEGQKYNIDLANLPTLVQNNINKILQEASKQANDLYNNVRNQIQPTNIGAEIEKINIEKQINIDIKIKNIQDAINNIKNSFNVTIDGSIEPFLAPYKELLISLNILFPNLNLSQLISLLPSLKEQTVNNIKPAIDNIINQYLPSVQTQINNIVGDLNLKFPSINETTIKAICAKYSGSSNYIICVDTQINEFKLYVSGVNNTLDNLFGPVAQANRSINLNVGGVIQTELQNVFKVSTDKAVNLLNISVDNIINVPKGINNNLVTDLVKQIDGYDVNRLVVDASTPVQIAFDNLQQQYPYINFTKTNLILQTLKDKLNNDLSNYLADVLKQVYNVQNISSAVNFDVGQFELKLKNCLNSNNDINVVVSVCVLPLINEANAELKNKSNILNNLWNEAKGINVTIVNQITLILNNYNVSANAVIKTSADEASTTDYVKAIEIDIALKINETLTTLDKIKTDVNALKQFGTDYLIKVQPQIEESIRPLVVAINATLRVQPNVNLTKQQEYLQKLVNDAKVKANATVLNEVNKYLNNISALTNEYNQVVVEFNNKIAEVNRVNLTVRCNRDSSTEIQFRVCVDNFYAEFKGYIDEFTTKINNLNNKASNLSVNIDANINANLTVILGQTFNLSSNASIDIYNKNNITGDNIIDFALEGGVKTYNITPILLTILQVSSSAQELERRNIYARGYANQTLFTSGSAIYDIVGVGRALCGQKSVDRQLNEAREKIAKETVYVFNNAPQLSEKIKELFDLSNEVNQTLSYQVSTLDDDKLKAKCPFNKTNQFWVYECIMVEVNKFGAYYDVEILKTRNYSRYANQELRTGSEALNKWRNEVVLPEAKLINDQLEQDAEEFYRKCGATPEKLVNYSLNVAKSHYNTFQPRVTSNFTEIVVLADRITKRNYTGYNISTRLESSVQPLYSAINAVLNSGNKSQITDEVRLAVQYLIQNSTGQFGAVLANFTTQTALYKQQALNLVNNRESVQNNYTYSYLYNRCYDPSSPLPLTDLVSCNNNQTYRNIFVINNNNTLNALLAIKADLINLDSTTQVINNAANNIDREFLKNVYTFAYRLYKNAGLPIPAEVAAQVEESRCVRGVTVSQYYCVVTT